MPDIGVGASEEVPARTDLRAPALGAVAWIAAVAAIIVPPWGWAVAAGTAVAGGWLQHRRGRLTRTHLSWALLGAAVLAAVLLRIMAIDRSPVDDLAEAGAMVRGTLVTTSEPRLRHGTYGDLVIVRARTEHVEGRGQRHRARAPVLLIGDRSWRQARVGTRVEFAGRLDQAADPDLAGILLARGPPRVLGGPGPLLRGAERVRAAIRSAVEHQDPGPRALVPALVDGDDAGLDPALEADFRTSGLTHLTAVSGTNLTLVVGALLILARGVGVRARGLMAVGVVGVVAFVLLARTEPSVVRAAAMGTVALIGMGNHGRERGVRALGVAVVALMVIDPWLAVSAGFALSALATAAILFLAPGWRDRLSRWLPRWVAEAIAVPLAAQIGCTPIVAGLSGQVSLVAVLANLLVEPVIAPATVLGLAGGLLALVVEPLGQVVATPAGWCAAWLIWVARRTAAMPVPALDWGSGPMAIAVLTLGCGLLVLLLGSVLARRGRTLVLCTVMLVVVTVPMPTPGWPPRGWVMVACEVGQGDALVLNAGGGVGVLVDAGPDPAAVDRCLRRLGIAELPVVVLTHFHADHIDGLAGALGGREVGEIQVTGLQEPLSGAKDVERLARRSGVRVRTPAYGESVELGPLRWQVVAPSGDPPPDSASPPNDASLVLLVQSRGVRLLLAGDQEDPSQRLVERSYGDLRVDVLKVAHHGSSRQDDDLIEKLGARLAVISVGAKNDYGHPAASTLHLLRDAGMRVARTDLDGDVAVVGDRGALGLVRRGRTRVGAS